MGADWAIESYWELMGSERNKFSLGVEQRLRNVRV